MRAATGFALALAVIGCLVFAGVAVTEFNYVSAHPYAYGPAKVIAWGACAGVLVSASVALLALSALRTD